MGKKRFITARDVDELLAQGKKELLVDLDTVVTDVGRERALERGLRIVKSGDAPEGAAPAGGSSSAAPAPAAGNKAELAEIIRKSVVAYLGRSPDNIDTVISKVLARF